MVIPIYRSASPVAYVKPIKAIHTAELSGRDEAQIEFVLSSPFAFALGDYITFDSVDYFLNTIPSVDKRSHREYAYNVKFESKLYDLSKVMFMFDERSDFYFNGDLRDIVDIIMINMERAYGADHVTLGEVDVTGYRNFYFKGENCLKVLHRMCMEWDKEFYFDGDELTITDTVGSDTGFTLSYGQGAGLYSLTRKQVQTKQIITRLYVLGSERNLPYDYRATGTTPKNLLNRSGATNLIDAIDHNGFCTKTYEGQGRYKFVCSGGTSAIRVWANDADMSDGNPYVGSTFFDGNTGSVVVVMNGGTPSGGSSAAAGRISASHTTTWTAANSYFEIRIATGEEIVLFNAQIEPGSSPTAYDGGFATTSGRYNRRLMFDSSGNNYIESGVGTYGLIEHLQIFDDIYPHRTGIISTVGTEHEFLDSGMDFDVNSYLLSGVTAKVHFNTGNLAGYRFDIEVYTHTGATLGDRYFRIIQNQDEQGFVLPTATLKPAVGDEYVIVDISLPASYVTAAETELLAEATAYLAQNDSPRIEYELTVDPVWVARESFTVGLGDAITIVDTPLSINSLIRVVKIDEDIRNPERIVIALSDSLEPSLIQRAYANEEAVERINTLRLAQDVPGSRLNWRSIAELQAMVWNPDGYFDPENIKPLSIETGMLTVGSKWSNFLVESTLDPNPGNDQTKFDASAGRLVHYAIDDTTIEWTLYASNITGLTEGTAYYAYAHVHKTELTNANNKILLSATEPALDDGTFYNFQIGILHSTVSGFRHFSATYGTTMINGRFITTGRIQNSGATTYFDLDTGDIVGKITFGTDSSGYENITDKPERYQASRLWQFGNGSHDGIVSVNCTGVDSDNGVTRTFTAITSDPQLIEDNIVSINGTRCYMVYARIKLITGSWDGTLYYRTSGHTWSDSYRKDISSPSIGVWTVVEFDMRSLTVGGTDYLDNDIIGWRFDFGASLSGEVAVDWISVGAYGEADATRTVIEGGLITTGTIQLGSTSTIKAGIHGGGTGDTEIRIWAGDTYANRATAPFRVTQGGALTATGATIASAGGTGQRIVIDSTLNNFRFYNSSNELTAEVGDNIYSTIDGIAVYEDGIIFVEDDAGNITRMHAGAIWCEQVAAQGYVSGTVYSELTYAASGLHYNIHSYTHSTSASATGNYRGVYSRVNITYGDELYGGYFLAENGNTNIGIYAEGDGWAGYFKGEVFVSKGIKARAIKAPATSVGHMMAYNGTDASGTNYRIGIAFSKDGYNFYKSANNPIISPVGATWEHDNVKDPTLLKVFDTYYIYYTGFGSTNQNQIGLATSRDGVNWTKYSGNPVVTFSDTNNIHRFPTVIYDENETNPAKVWKMWYVDASWNIGYAYSPDGYTWTKYGSNPVLSKGSGGSWDESNILPGPIYYEDGTWYLYYGGKSGSFWQTGLATFTNPESTYTKDGSNPIIARRSSAGASLTANLMTGNKVVTIADTSIFEVNEYVWLYDSTVSTQLNRIFSIDSSTQLTLRDAATDDFTTAQSALIRSIYYGSIVPSSVYYDGEDYILAITEFQILNDLGFDIREHCGIAKSSLLDSGWNIDFDKGLILQMGNTTDWDEWSAENPSLIPMSDDELLSIISGLTVKEGTPVLPSFTTTQRDNISSPANGMILYNTTLNKVQVYENSAWASVI